MRVVQRLPSARCNCLSCAYDVPDLPPVLRRRSELHELPLAEAIVMQSCSTEDGHPDFTASGVSQWVVAEGDVDARLECRVEGLDAICSQKQDAFEVPDKANLTPVTQVNEENRSL